MSQGPAGSDFARVGCLLAALFVFPLQTAAQRHSEHCWLEQKSGLALSLFYGANPSVSELQLELRKLAAKYDLPVQILAGLCAQESGGGYHYDADGYAGLEASNSGFLVHNITECKDLFFDNPTAPNPPPGLGLMQLTGKTAGPPVDFPKLCSDWRFNLDRGANRLAGTYVDALRTTPECMLETEKQNKGILENWFYAVVYYRGFPAGDAATRHGSILHAYSVIGHIAVPPIRLRGLFMPVTLTRPDSFASWIEGHPIAATADGTWLVGTDCTEHSGAVNFSCGPAQQSVGNDLSLRLPFNKDAAFQVTQAYCQAGGSHHGFEVDFNLPRRTPVVAVADATVDKVGNYASNCPDGCGDAEKNAGIYVKLKHEGSRSIWYSSYLHLDGRAAALTVGTKVQSGDVIGYSGNSGWARGYHLHFQMKDECDLGVRPVPIHGVDLSAPGSTVIEDFIEGHTYRAIDLPPAAGVVLQCLASDSRLPVKDVPVTLDGMPVGMTTRSGEVMVPFSLCGTRLVEAARGTLFFRGLVEIACPPPPALPLLDPFGGEEAPERVAFFQPAGMMPTNVLLVSTQSCALMPPSTRFATGDVVEVFATGIGLRARFAEPCGANYEVMPDGAIGVVVGGPECCNGYQRCKIAYADLRGVEAWSAEGEPSTGEFFLRKVTAACPDDEPNNRSIDAMRLALTAPHPAYICTSGDVDWFRVDVPGAGSLRFDLVVPAGNDFDLELYGPDNLWRQGSYRDVGLAESIAFNVTDSSPAAYYVRVYGYPVGNGSYNASQPYTLTATFTNGAFVTNETITLLSQPANASVIEGASAVFRVTAISSLPLGYQWQRNGTNISGATDYIYVTPPATSADSGAQFTVQVTSFFGAVVVGPVSLTVTPASVVRWVGGFSWDWTNLNNWFPPVLPTASHSVFITNGASVTVPADAEFGVLTFNSGALSGSFNVSSTMNWSGGTLNAGANITILSGGVMNLSGTADKIVNGIIHNFGYMAWSDGRLWRNFSGTVINNYGTFEEVVIPHAPQALRAEAGLEPGGGFFPASGYVQFQNYGRYLNTRGSFTSYINVDLNNLGTVEIQRGGLALTGNGGGAGSGVWKMGANTTFEVAGGYVFQPGASFEGGGGLRISGGTATVQSNINISVIELGQGALAGNGTVTVTNLTWTGGSMDGGGTTTIPAGGTLTITGASTKSLGSRVLNNFGDGTWSDGGPISAGSSSVNSFANFGTMTLRSDAAYSWNGGFYGAFGNYGRLVKVQDAGTTLFDGVYFSNYGTVEVQRGTVSVVGNGSSAGRWTVAEGAFLNFPQWTHSFGSGTTMDGPGLVQFNGATLNFNGEARVENASLIGSAVNFNARAAIGTLNFSSGLLGGSNTVTITNLTWTGGSMDGGGTTTIPAGGTLTIAGGFTKSLGSRVLNNVGDGTWSDDGPISAGSSSVNSFANFGTMTLRSDAAYSWNGGTYGAFGNYGRLVKEQGTGTSLFDRVYFSNYGTVEVQRGTVSVVGNGGSAGRWTVADGAFLNFPQWTHYFSSGTTMDGPGLVQFNGATLNFNGEARVENASLISSAVNFNAPAYLGTMTLNGGVANFNAPANLDNATIINGTLAGGGNTTITNLNWLGGTMSGSGTTLIPPGGALTIGGAATKYLSTRFLYNQGGAIWSDSGTLRLDSGATLGNAGTFVVMNDEMAQHGGGSQTWFHNYAGGRFVKMAGTGTTVFSGVPFYNWGVVDLKRGTLQLASGYTQASAGTLRFGLGGHDPASGYGRMTVGTTATLAGVLEAEALNGFQPTNAARFAVLTYGPRNGAFSTLTTTNLPGLTLIPQYGSATFELVAYTLPSISAVTRRPDGQLELTITSPNGWNQRVDASTDLSSWVTLTNFSSGPGPWLFLDPEAASLPRRFYRTVTPP